MLLNSFPSQLCLKNSSLSGREVPTPIVPPSKGLTKSILETRSNSNSSRPTRCGCRGCFTKLAAGTGVVVSGPIGGHPGLPVQYRDQRHLRNTSRSGGGREERSWRKIRVSQSQVLPQQNRYQLHHGKASATPSSHPPKPDVKSQKHRLNTPETKDV